MIKKYNIEGLDCANCARELEEELNKLEGVTSATVDFIGKKVIVDCTENAIDPVLYCCNHFEEAEITGEIGGESASEKAVADGKKFKIANLCCANCARELEEELNKLDGVSATVDFMNMTVILRASSTSAYDSAVHCITHFEDVKIVDEGAEKKKSVFKENLKDIIAVIVSAVFFICGRSRLLKTGRLGGIRNLRAVRRSVCRGGPYRSLEHCAQYNKR